jgi:HSP20 family protein
MSFNLPIMKSFFDPNRSLGLTSPSFIDNWFNDMNRGSYERRLTPTEFCPSVDISETDSDYYLEAELPGLKKEDIDIKLNGNIIYIHGKKEQTKEHKDRNFSTREISYGVFQKSMTLPPDIKSEAIDADLRDGILKIKIPRSKSSATKKISVK